MSDVTKIGVQLELARVEIDRAHDRHVAGDKEARVYHLIRAVEWIIRELEEKSDNA